MSQSLGAGCRAHNCMRQGITIEACSSETDHMTWQEPDCLCEESCRNMGKVLAPSKRTQYKICTSRLAEGQRGIKALRSGWLKDSIMQVLWTQFIVLLYRTWGHSPPLVSPASALPAGKEGEDFKGSRPCQMGKSLQKTFQREIWWVLPDQASKTKTGQISLK